VGCETHPRSPQRSGEAEGSPAWGLPGWAGAALTTYRSGDTTRRRGRASKVERCNASEPVADTPSCVNGSNLVDEGRSSTREAMVDGDPTRQVRWRRTWRGRAQNCVVCATWLQEQSWAPPHPTEHCERGKRPRDAYARHLEHGQGQRRLMPRGRGGGPVVVGGRESRPQGEGDQ
jgi:hypothetical protein